jgi:hypothetical protein
MCRVKVPVSVAVRSPSGKLMMRIRSERGIAWPLVWIESSTIADHNALYAFEESHLLCNVCLLQDKEICREIEES